MGHDVLMSDVDVVWRRDPRPYLLCARRETRTRGEEVPGGAWDDCGAMTDADEALAVSSDNLSPKTDASDARGVRARRASSTPASSSSDARGTDVRSRASWDAHLNARATVDTPR